MKRTIIAIWALLVCQVVLAKVVTESQARQRAAEFFAAAEVGTRATTTVRPTDFKMLATFPEMATRSSTSDPLIYIFQRESGGYAIMSGDDVARPVLGYSPSGHFPITDIPDNLRALLQWYADIINFARQQHWATRPMATADGLDPTNTVKLQTAQWDQGSPFNDLVEEINGQKPPIGCVATAIAIIMRYHKWPKRGTGTLPSYDHKYNGETYHVDGITLGHEYDWDKMPEDPRNCTEEEAAQISRLLYDVAVMCQMEFAPGGSGASETESAMRLPIFFDYDKRIQFDERRFISDDEWERYLIKEIDSGRPVLYSGARPGGAHAFVIDGYNGHYFSINHGWGGHANGFYTVTPVEGHEEELLLFYSSQGMTREIMPDSGVAPQTNLITRSNIIVPPPDFSVGKEFYLSLWVDNWAFGYPSLDFCYLLYDRFGSIKERISTSVEISESHAYEHAGYGVYSYCKVTKELKDGDMIAVAAQDAQSGEWIPIRQSRVCTIGFTSRPLADLVEVGYIEEPVGEKTDIYLKLYKDLCWELLKETQNGYQTILLHTWPNNVFVRDEVTALRFCLYDNGEYGYFFDSDCDTFIYEIGVPTGRYILRVRNPLTNEQMDITLEL